MARDALCRKLVKYLLEECSFSAIGAQGKKRIRLEECAVGVVRRTRRGKGISGKGRRRDESNEDFEVKETQRRKERNSTG